MRYTTMERIEKPDLGKKESDTVSVTIQTAERTIKIDYNKQDSLHEAMAKQGIRMNAACGGRGTCGKCRIKLLNGSLECTLSDQKLFTGEELKEGYRLACKAHPSTDISIRILEGEENEFEVVADLYHKPSESVADESERRSMDKSNIHGSNKAHRNSNINASSFGIAVDLGTTTLAMTLIELESGTIIETFTSLNHQRAYGSDVITRIQLSNQGKQKELQDCIRGDLLEGFQSLISKNNIKSDSVKSIVIAGNTTMGHLLLGHSCKNLGVYPFIPVNIQEQRLTFYEVFESYEFHAEVVIIPGISAFVGGDITAGLLVNGYDSEDKINLFIDLGTNGEMAIGNHEKILVSSTAAGPAFEGGNISCGVGSIAGAITGVEFLQDKIKIKTIGDKPPVGICGTGIIELTYELLKHNIIDDTGLLIPEYFEEGFPIANEDGGAIRYTQKDIREFQMAKAAIRAGIEILVRSYNMSYEDIETVYVAGGFGYKLNMVKAIYVGLIPKELSHKIKTVGNSSLQGAIHYLKDDKASLKIKNIINKSTEKHLSNDDDFNDLYISCMGFEEEEQSI